MENNKEINGMNIFSMSQMLHDIGDSGTWKIGCALQWLNNFFAPALTNISYIPKVQPIPPLILVFYYDLLLQDSEFIIRNSTFQKSMVSIFYFMKVFVKCYPAQIMDLRQLYFVVD